MKEAMNYTSEMVSEMVARYQADPTMETVEALAEEFGKPVKSVIAKLSHERVYQKQPRLNKAGLPVVRKEELVRIISTQLGFEVESFGKASKLDLLRLSMKLQALQNEQVESTK
jgi:N-methylhydantoinase B/oxoprolinase/acetone carboxylase alpha subunit